MPTASRSAWSAVGVSLWLLFNRLGWFPANKLFHPADLPISSHGVDRGTPLASFTDVNDPVERSIGSNLATQE